MRSISAIRPVYPPPYQRTAQTAMASLPDRTTPRFNGSRIIDNGPIIPNARQTTGTNRRSFLGNTIKAALAGAALMMPGISLAKTQEVAPVQNLTQLAKDHEVIDLFLKLVKIPTPTISQHRPEFHREIHQNFKKMNQEVIRQYFKDLSLEFKRPIAVTEYPDHTMYIRIPGTAGLQTEPLMLVAHTDVVATNPDDPLFKITPQLDVIEDELSIHTGGKGPLGGDDKRCVAASMRAAKELLIDETKGIPFGTIELLYSPDEEGDMRSYRSWQEKAPFKTPFQSKYALNLDGGSDLSVSAAGASFVDITTTLKQSDAAANVPPKYNAEEFPFSTKVKITLDGFRGGHSSGSVNNPLTNAICQMANSIIPALGLDNDYPESQKGRVALTPLEISGGYADNAVPDKAVLIIGMRGKRQEDIQKDIEEIRMMMGDVKTSIRKQYDEKMDELDISLEDRKSPEIHVEELKYPGVVDFPSPGNAIAQMSIYIDNFGTGHLPSQGPAEGISKNIGLISGNAKAVKMVTSVRSRTLPRQTDLINQIKTNMDEATRTYQKSNVPLAFTYDIDYQYPPGKYEHNLPFAQFAAKSLKALDGREVHVGRSGGTSQASWLTAIPNANGDDPVSITIGSSNSGAHTNGERSGVESLIAFPRRIAHLAQDFAKTYRIT